LPRLYLKLILPIALIFLALTLTARALGTTQPPNPSLRGFIEGCEGKPQPCWYGIVPGVTTIEEAKIILATHDYWERPNYLLYDEGYEYVNISEAPSCVTLVRYEGDTVVRELSLGCLGIRLGDVISYWGTPKTLGYGEVRSIDYLGYSGYFIGLVRSNLQAYLWVHDIHLHTQPKNSPEQSFERRRWRGFAPFWRYCQLNHMAFVCPGRTWFAPKTTLIPAFPTNNTANSVVLPTLPPYDPTATLAPA
jgi:hypothetical protein